MKLILQFLKPHWKLTVLTVLLAVIDVGGSLFIPTLAAHLLNQGTSGVAFEELLTTGLQMGAVSLFSSICAILGGYACATLAARVGKDMRVALYEKSLKLSVYDFRQFGTASITTRTVSDITTIQFALTSFIQMVLPVPLVCIIALALSFQPNSTLGTILLILTALVFILALGIMRSASPLFKKLQKLLDRMTTILLENITGVRVVRAFNNEEREQNRMSDAFSNYAETSIKANRRFANLDGLSYFFINLFVVIVYWLSGGYISLGNLQIGDITAVIQYAMMVMFFLMMAQMVILTMPRALECCERIRAVLEHSPEIRDLVEQDDQKSLPNQDEVLAFRNVSFRFADAEENTLSHLNFSCRRGQTTAIIGGTGSGKSTVASLILRFHDRHRRLHPAKRQGYPPDDSAYPARSPGLCAAESLAVLRHHCQQPALRQRGRHRRAADARRRRRPGRRFYPFAAGRLKFLCGTGRHQLFRRPEAASFHCPRSGQKAGAVHLR